MAEVIRGSYKDIADAIRAKKGTSKEMTPAEMPGEIAEIVKPTGTLEITENGEGIDVAQYAEVNVDVQGGGSFGSGIWWVSDDPAYDPVNLATEAYEGWYNVTPYSGSGSNPPESYTFDTNCWYRYTGDGFEGGDELNRGTFYYYNEYFSSQDIGTSECMNNTLLVATGGSDACKIEKLQSDQYQDIGITDISVGDSVTIEWSGYTYTLTRNS